MHAKNNTQLKYMRVVSHARFIVIAYFFSHLLRIYQFIFAIRIIGVDSAKEYKGVQLSLAIEVYTNK